MKNSSKNTERTYAPNHNIHDIQPNDIVYEESEADFIERCPHDKENPYVIINVEILRNPNISPACRWLICYLLSNEKGWRINRKQVANHVKEYLGRDRTDKIFEEALKAGYMKRVNILVKRKGGGALRRCKYYISETPKFKNSFQCPEIQGSGSALTEDQGDKVITSEEITNCSVCVESSPVAPPPPEKIVKKDFKGKELHLTKQDLYAQCVMEKKDWAEAEIEEAWKILEEYSCPVRDCFKFVEGTIKNRRKLRKLKQIEEDTPCQKQKNTPPSKEPLPITNKKTSENVTLGRPLANWRQLILPDKKS